MAQDLAAGPKASEIVAGPPYAPGGYIEPNYHFQSAGPPSPLFEAIIEEMETLAVDLQVNADHFSAKGAFYRHGGRISIKISLYTLPRAEHPMYAAEFQRRSGDVIAFSEMYHSAVEALNARKLVVNPDAARWPSFSEVQYFPDDAPTESECREVVDNLLSMACTPKLWAQGLQGLSQMAAGSHAAKSAVMQRAWDKLVECTGCEDEDVHRCAITAVADLLSSEPVSSAVLTKPNFGTALHNIELKLQSRVPEVVRQSNRALANLEKARQNMQLRPL